MKIKSILLGKGLSAFAVFVFAFVFSSSRVLAACSLTPERATNTVGQVHGVTAHVMTNSTPVPGLVMSFTITSGPNASTSGSFTTGAGGDATFTYAGNGGAGTDIIQATGTVNGMAFTCLATQVWVAVVVPPPTCTLTPESATNVLGAVHGITAHVTTNSTAVGGVLVTFVITSGPNASIGGTSVTGPNGDAVFNYTGNGGAGTDIIQATGTVNGIAFTCLATQVWVFAPPIQCPPNIVTNNEPDSCSRSVEFAVGASGTPMPTIRCQIGDTLITSPHIFPAGLTTVNCTASNINGAASCSFTVRVTESVPPEILCPNDVFATALPGETNAVVFFDLPFATDACSDVVLVCDPPSGSVFPLGTSMVNCTATDSSGNTNSCAFAVTVSETPPETHDMAVVKITAPKFVKLTAVRPTVTKRVIVTIQNRSPHTETIFDSVQFTNLVTLSVQSLDTNICFDVVPVFLERPPQRRLAFNLKSKQKINVYFDVTFDCAVNPAKGLGQEDFRYVAIVNHAAIDGLADTHPECDVCPRPPLEGHVDPNPNGRIKDKGCGAPAGGGTFGNDVLTDVYFK